MEGFGVYDAARLPLLRRCVTQCCNTELLHGYLASVANFSLENFFQT
jgi:hypothetical protein